MPPKQSFVQLFKLAIPIIALQFSQMAMGIADTIMSGYSSLEDLAAVAIGASIWLPVFLFMAGVLTAVTPTVAHLNGENKQSRIGHVIRQSGWIALILGIIALIILQHIAFILDIMQVEKNISPIIIDYLDATSWGFPGIAFFLLLRYLNEGMAKTVPIMIVAFIGLLVNVLLNYTLIFGHFGFSAMGGVGAGWATAITQWFMVLMLLFYIKLSPFFEQIDLFVNEFKIDLDEIYTLFKLGLPIGIAFFVEGSIFSVIALFVASLGTIVVASHQIALNISSLLFMIPLSLSMAMTILIGHARGSNNLQVLIHNLKTGYIVTFIQALFVASFIVIFADQITYLYTPNIEVITLASQLMILAALYQLSDAIQLCSAGILRGLKDTTIPMVFSIISFWIIGFPLGYILGLTDLILPAMGAAGFWLGLIAGLSLSAILLTYRVYNQISSLQASLKQTEPNKTL